MGMGHAFSSATTLSWRSIASISDTFWRASPHHDLTVSSEFIIHQFFETRGSMGSAGVKPLAPVEEPGQHQKLLQLLELGKAAGLL